MVFIMKTTPLHSPNRSQLRRDSFLILFGRRLALPLFFSCAALLIQPCAAQWEFTGNLNVARDYQTATLLSNGKVLVASGATNGPQAFQYPQITSSELYDKATGTWTLTGSLTDARVLHTAALLLNGQVLVGRLAQPYPYWWSTGNRGTLRPGHRKLDTDRQHEYSPCLPH